MKAVIIFLNHDAIPAYAKADASCGGTDGFQPMDCYSVVGTTEVADARGETLEGLTQLSFPGSDRVMVSGDLVVLNGDAVVLCRIGGWQSVPGELAMPFIKLAAEGGA